MKPYVTVVISTQVTSHLTARVDLYKAINVDVFGLTTWTECASCTPLQVVYIR